MMNVHGGSFLLFANFSHETVSKSEVNRFYLCTLINASFYVLKMRRQESDDFINFNKVTDAHIKTSHANVFVQHF